LPQNDEDLLHPGGSANPPGRDRGIIAVDVFIAAAEQTIDRPRALAAAKQKK
jgi:hypothetical protein